MHVIHLRDITFCCGQPSCCCDCERSGMERFTEAIRVRVDEMLLRSGIHPPQVELIGEVGSTAHGISAGTGHDDLDLTVVWTESLRDMMALNDHGSRMLRTQPEGVRSGPGDIDLQVYSMRKFVSLAAIGNPSIIMVLFTPPEFRMKDQVFPDDQIIELTRSLRVGAAFLGYLDAQFSRWQAGKVRSRVHRPELIEAHGYDTKYAAHAIRLGLQGVEYLTTGRIAIPMEEPVAGQIRDIRAGRTSEADALGWCGQVRHDLKGALAKADMPATPDRDAILSWLADWHREGIL